MQGSRRNPWLRTVLFFGTGFAALALAIYVALAPGGAFDESRQVPLAIALILAVFLYLWDSSRPHRQPVAARRDSSSRRARDDRFAHHRVRQTAYPMW